MENYLYIALGMLLAVSVHEAAHVAAAYYLGDPTAKLAGRLSLNPLRHLDPLGTIMILIIGFGWGKPVPVNPYNLKNPRSGEALISLAGPMSNFFLAALLALPLKYFFLGFEAGFGAVLAQFLAVTIYLNIALMVFNLLPIPPLDGSKVVAAFLPLSWDAKIARFEKNGWILLFGIIILSRILNFQIFSYIVGPLVDFVQSLIFLTT